MPSRKISMSIGDSLFIPRAFHRTLTYFTAFNLGYRSRAWLVDGNRVRVYAARNPGRLSGTGRADSRDYKSEYDPYSVRISLLPECGGFLGSPGADRPRSRQREVGHKYSPLDMPACTCARVGLRHGSGRNRERRILTS